MTTGVIHALLAFGLIAVVPAALALVGESAKWRWALASGAVAAGSFLLGTGLGAAALTIPWLALACVIAVARLRRMPSWGIDSILEVVPVLYLVGGAGWLAIARYGEIDLGFGLRITELAAVHFHYAGFVASALTLELVRWLRAKRPARAGLGVVAFLLVLGATPLTAAGITFAPVFGALGASCFALGLVMGSALTFSLVVPSATRPASGFLAVSSLSIIATIALAVAYSFGQWLGTPALSLEVMAWSHGILNAVAFALCGTLGWKLVRARGGYK